MENNKTIFQKDLPGKKITVTRMFDAPPELVWRTWTEPELLDLWWAPHPWRAETKSMDFRKGGHWLYAMVGPDQNRHWARIEYTRVEPITCFEGNDFFCDENGKKIAEMPSMEWKTNFKASTKGTEVVVDIKFASEKAAKQLIEMGFEAGFTSALSNLDQYLRAQFKLRTELKTNQGARVTTYLNFPGTTEKAFSFYREVFGTEFSGKGIQRFGDIPAESGHPPVAEAIKKMILHIELPILNGHILMATDAPKELGMTLVQGSNMHICLEPATRTETKKLFESLSKNGKVTMPLEDMFFGSYFGSCTDQFGINWMFNCIEK